jgi:hypothetical protein
MTVPDNNGYAEVIWRLVGLNPEPEGPAVIGVIVRVPITGVTDSLKMIEACVNVATPHMPKWPGEVQTSRVEVMLDGVWRAESGDE